MTSHADETVPEGAARPFGMTPPILHTIPGASPMVTRTFCSDYPVLPTRPFTHKTVPTMKKIFLLALLSLSVLGSYAQTHDKATNDTLSSAAPIEQWEYKTIYVHNTHQHARQGEVEFKSHKDAENLNKYGREGWELVAVTPVVGEPIGNDRTYTLMLVYTFKRRLSAKR